MFARESITGGQKKEKAADKLIRRLFFIIIRIICLQD
jgi:hypothetical protein